MNLSIEPYTICALQQEKWNYLLRNNIAAPKKYFMAKFKEEEDRIVGPILRAMVFYAQRPRRSIPKPPAARAPRKAFTSIENLPERPKRIIKKPSRYAKEDTPIKDTPKLIKKRTTKKSSKESSPKVSTVRATPKKPSPVSAILAKAGKNQINVLTIAPKTNVTAQQRAFELSSCEERLVHPMSQSRLI